MEGTKQADQTFSKERQIVSRWGHPAADDRGYVDIPGWILRNYHKCGVTPLEMMFIAHVMAFKFDHAADKSENAARPSLETIATYMGRNVKNVRALKNKLIKDKLLTVKSQKGKCDEYNFAGFTQLCWQYEVDPQYPLRKRTQYKNVPRTKTVGAKTYPEDSEVPKDSESKTSLQPAAGASVADAPEVAAKAVEPPSKQESVEPVKDGLKALAEKGRKPKEHKPPDPVFRWVCDYLGVNPDVAWGSSKHEAWGMRGYIIAEEKGRLKQTIPLTDDQLADAAKLLPGFPTWYDKECKDCSLPRYRRFQTWIGKWYLAGRPGNSNDNKWEFDPMTGWRPPKNGQ